MSKYVARLLQSTASTTSLKTWLLDSSCLAVHFARQTRTAESRALSELVRAKGRDVQIASVAARLHLAEAINHANEANLESARTSCRRSHLLARIDLIAYCEVAAWLAHFEQLNGNENETLALLKSAFEIATPTDHIGVFRASLTLADELHSLGRFQEALEFYHAARRCAELVGDDAAVCELLFNIAAHGIENCRIAATEGRDTDPGTNFFVSHATSARRYSDILQIRGGEWMFSLLWMHIEALTERYHLLNLPGFWDQLSIIRVSRPDLHWILRVDKILSEIDSTPQRDTLTSLLEILENSVHVPGSEELCIFYHQLSKAFRRLKESNRASHCRQRSEEHLHCLTNERRRRLESEALVTTINSGRNCLRSIHAL